MPLLVLPTAPPPPAGLRRQLALWLRPDGDASDEEALTWLGQWALQLGQLNRSVLANVDQGLGLRDDGEPLSPSTAARFRKVSRACIRRAVDLGVLDTDPWPPASRGRSQRKATRTRRAVAVRALPDPNTMRRAIDAIASHQPASRTYQVMTAAAYYAGLRPSEVVIAPDQGVAPPGKGLGPDRGDRGRCRLRRAG